MEYQQERLELCAGSCSVLALLSFVRAETAYLHVRCAVPSQSTPRKLMKSPFYPRFSRMEMSLLIYTNLSFADPSQGVRMRNVFDFLSVLTKNCAFKLSSW